ncbi:MAG: c-type cytochrome [Cyclobacteriaceae bacterium]|nr:c-type cytochrome [Cyclobacteriaceae bacterium]
MLFTALYHTHRLVVTLFVLIYLIKTFLLLIGSDGALDKFSKFIRVPEIVISTLFLVTGGIMVIHVANFGFLFIVKLLFVLVAIPLAIVGFRKKKKILAFVSFLLLIGAYGIAEIYVAQFGKRKAFTEEVITNPDARNYDLSLHGKALFNAQCAVCHGTDGTAGLSGAANLQKSQMNSEQIIDIINNGKSTMPAMKDKYNEQELKALVKYVKELRLQD